MLAYAHIERRFLQTNDLYFQISQSESFIGNQMESKCTLLLSL